MKRARSAALFVLFALSLGSAQGQTASLVRDINEGRIPPGDSHPGRFHAALGKVFFTALAELWVTDGTDSGTRFLADLCSGACPSDFGILGSVPGALLALGGSETRLLRTDGTAAGTFPLTGPELGVEVVASLEEGLRLFSGGSFYFSGCEPGPDGRCGLWKTDGSPAGTVPVVITGPFYPALLTPFGDRIAFMAGDTLWISDGTPAGTSAVVPFHDARVERITAAAGKLFLVVDRPREGEELWVSDGTEAGTKLLKELAPSQDANRWLKQGQRGVYFLAGGGSQPAPLWFSDGTPNGTRLVTDSPVEYADQLEETGGRLVFLSRESSTYFLRTATADPEVSPVLLESELSPALFKVGDRVVLVVWGRAGQELWTTDGTPAGTRLVLDICPGGCSGVSETPFPSPGGLLFVGNDNQNGSEIWTSDGTGPGTRRLTGLPGHYLPYASNSPGAVLLGNRLFFGAHSAYGIELWVSEGPDDTRLVTNIAGDSAGSDPRDLLPLGDRLFFTACDGVRRTVWTSTGERETTSSLGPATGDLCGFYEEPEGLVAAGGQAFFRTEDGELWRTDGTPGGTRQLATSVYGIAPLHGHLYFVVWSGGKATLWKTDGTQPGTVEVLDVAGAVGGFGLTAVGSELYFAVLDPGAGNTQIWKSDGTAAGTRKIAAVEGSYEDDETPGFLRAGSWIYFLDGTSGRIWKTDGTEAGTSPLEPLGQDYVGPSSLTEHGGLLYFLSSASTLPQRTLWRSDGTAAGTLPVKTFAVPRTHHPLPAVLTSFAGRLFFTAYDALHGVEPWVSDGSTGGTVLLKDIFPGEESSLPDGFTAAGGRIFFAAKDDVHGSELWQSDGTEAGTKMVQDIAPFVQSSSPSDLTAAGNRLYFTADDGVTGRELWLLPLAEAGCTPSPGHLCLGKRRFRVEAFWRDFQGNQGTAKAVGLTADTGYFWFFSPTNVEVILKVLDGTGVNGHRWVFYGALSSVEYTLTVTDTQTGLTRRYFNPMGQLGSVGDTTSFGPLGAFSVAEPAVQAEEKTVAAGPCEATTERLCLNDQRFAVEVAWKDFQGNQGKGKAVNLTADTGYFWFFDAANVEVVIKVLDGTSLNGKHWVFYGALSSVEYTITVTDTQTGVQKIYKNPSGTLASVADTEAF